MLLTANDYVITMDGPTQFTGTVAIEQPHGSSGNATVVNDASGLNLAWPQPSAVILIATATTGNIVDSGVLTIAGTSSFTTSQNNADIILNNANAFTGTVALNTTGSSGNATVVDASGLNLAASTVGGNLIATATTGNIVDSGVLTIAGYFFIHHGCKITRTITLDLANVLTGTVALNTSGADGHGIG